MIKIFTEGNYFFIVENEIEYEAHAKEVKVHRFSTASEIFIFKNVNQWDGTRKVNLSDIVDKDDAPYTLESFLTFKNEETGKSSTGGGGETTEPEPIEPTSQWIFLASHFSIEPEEVATIDDGTVFKYTLEGVERFRLVPEPYDPTEDAFFEAFDGTTLTNLIIKRG